FWWVRRIQFFFLRGFERSGAAALAHIFRRRREEGVVHVAVFLDRVGFRYVIAVCVEIEEVTLREQLLVVEADPLLPVIFLLLIKIDALEFRSVVGPGELGAEDATGSE